MVTAPTKPTDEAAVAEGVVAQGAGVTFAAQMPVGTGYGRFLLLSAVEWGAVLAVWATGADLLAVWATGANLLALWATPPIGREARGGG